MELNIAIIQADIRWERVRENLNHFEKLLAEVEVNTDLVVLPEMFNTGFTMKPDMIAEDESGPTIDWMRRKSSELEAHICGSIPFKLSNGHFANRLIWMRPDGSWAHYDKRHLFTLSGEDLAYKAGNEKLIVDIKGIKVCPLICYDLRFPVWSRNTEGYDMLIYMANWPVTRIKAWDALLAARAIENQCYTIGVNRIGKDGNGLAYNGHSAIYSFDGERLSFANETEQCLQTKINLENQEDFRRRLDFLGDKDVFTIKK